MDTVIEFLFNKYKSQGFLTEDELFDYATEHSLSIMDTGIVTDKLLSMGVIIRNPPKDDKEEYDASKIDYNELFNKILIEFPQAKSLIKYIKKVQPPQKNEWQELFPQINNNNAWAYQRLFDMYLRQVLRTAWQYYQTYNLSFLDAFQEGCAGLIQAIEKFDTSEYNSFPAFVTRPIMNLMTRNCDLPQGRMFDVPYHIKENLYKIYTIVDEHYCQECMGQKRKNECETLKDEIMTKLDCSLAEATEYLNILTGHEFKIFDLIDADWNDPVELYSRNELKQVVDKLFQELLPQDQMVLMYRYGIGPREAQTLEEVGESLGVTRERVRQIEQKALNKLKHPTRAKILRSFLEAGGTPVNCGYKNLKDYISRVAPSINSMPRKASPSVITPWTAADIKTMLKLAKQGKSASEIGNVLNRSRSSVIGKLNRLGVKVTE